MQSQNPNPIGPLTFDGQRIDRIPHGADDREVAHDAYRCPDCGVREGVIHLLGCEMEICPSCGEELAECPCGFGFEA